MQIIPVIDILNGIVVHAIKGQRKEYKPLQSILINSVNPTSIAVEFKKLGFNQLYIADLDAIITCSMNFLAVKQIAEKTNLELMVDAGITSIQRAQHLLNSGVSVLIIGTETLQRQDFIEKAVSCFGIDHVIVSLDLKREKVIINNEFENSNISPMCLLENIKSMGVTKVIVLDLIRVGSGVGVNIEFLKRIKKEIGIDIYVGGGVRDIGDLIELRALGVSGALVATALHNGKISVEELKREGFL